MQTPVTQEEIDLKSDLSNSLRNVSDIMNTLNDIDDNILKTKALKVLLSETLANQDITNILEEYIKEQEEKENKEEEPETNEEEGLGGLGGEEGFSEPTPEDMGFNPMEGAPSAQEEESSEVSEKEIPEETETTEQPEPQEEENNELPSPSDLGVDLTVNPQR